MLLDYNHRFGSCEVTAFDGVVYNAAYWYVGSAELNFIHTFYCVYCSGCVPICRLHQLQWRLLLLPAWHVEVNHCICSEWVRLVLEQCISWNFWVICSEAQIQPVGLHFASRIWFASCYIRSNTIMLAQSSVFRAFSFATVNNTSPSFSTALLLSLTSSLSCQCLLLVCHSCFHLLWLRLDLTSINSMPFILAVNWYPKISLKLFAVTSIVTISPAFTDYLLLQISTLCCFCYLLRFQLLLLRC